MASRASGPRRIPGSETAQPCIPTRPPGRGDPAQRQPIGGRYRARACRSRRERFLARLAEQRASDDLQSPSSTSAPRSRRPLSAPALERLGAPCQHAGHSPRVCSSAARSTWPLARQLGYRSSAKRCCAAASRATAFADACERSYRRARGQVLRGTPVSELAGDLLLASGGGRRAWHRGDTQRWRATSPVGYGSAQITLSRASLRATASCSSARADSASIAAIRSASRRRSFSACCNEAKCASMRSD